jgi:hypothetical protein
MFVLIMYGPAEALPKTKCPEFLDQLPHIVHLQIEIRHIISHIHCYWFTSHYPFLFHRTKPSKYQRVSGSNPETTSIHINPPVMVGFTMFNPLLNGPKSQDSVKFAKSNHFWTLGPWELRPCSTSEVTGSPGQGRAKFILMGKVSCKLY